MAGAAPTAKPAPFYRWVDYLDTSILLAENALCVVVVGVMVLCAVPAAANVIAQFFGSQIAWAQRLDDVLLNGTVWAAFLGASFATRGRRHLAIDAVGRLLPDRARRATVALTTTVGSVVAFALAYGVAGAIEEAVKRDKSYELTYVIVGGFGLIGARLLLHGFHELVATVFGVEAEEPHHKVPTEAELKAAEEAKPPSALHTATKPELAIAATLVVALGVAMSFTSAMVPGLVVCGAAVGVLAYGLFRKRARRAPAVAPKKVAAPVEPAEKDEKKDAEPAAAPAEKKEEPKADATAAKDAGAKDVEKKTEGDAPAEKKAEADAPDEGKAEAPDDEKVDTARAIAAMDAVEHDADPPRNVRHVKDTATAVKEIAVGLLGVGAILWATTTTAGHIADIPIIWGVVFFAIMALLGAPLFTFLGGLALFLWLHGVQQDDGQWVVPPPEAGRFYNTVEDVLGTHFARMSVLPTIPIFTLAGYLMSESKTPQRLVRLARAFLGWMPGGLAVVCILASAVFTVFSGASGITIVAIGGLLFPALVRDKYPERFSLGLVTTGGALGITFFPCLPLIVYGIVAGLQEPPPGMEKVDLQELAKAGILPGLLIIVLLMIYAVGVGVFTKIPRSKVDVREMGAALWEAKWEILIPVVVVIGLKNLGPTQGSALTALYVLIVEVFVYKDISFGKDLPRIIPESMVLVGAIFVKICAATVLTFFFVQAQTADRLFEVLTCGPPAQHCFEHIQHTTQIFGSCREVVDQVYTPTRSGGLLDSPISFLIALNLFLLVVGMLMDIFSAIVILVPLLTGIAIAFKINPYHLGIVFLINLEIGYLMPPMGLNLFIAGFRFGKPVPQLYRVVLPFIGVFAIALLATTYNHTLALSLLHDQYEPIDARPGAPPPELPSLDVCNEHPAPEGGGGGTEEDAGAGGGGDCDEPRPGEPFPDFQARCMGGDDETGTAEDAGAPVDAGPPPPVDPNAPIADDCLEPRPGEPFPAFQQRCHM